MARRVTGAATSSVTSASTPREVAQVVGELDADGIRGGHGFFRRKLLAPSLQSSQLSALSFQLSALSYQLSAFSYQLSAFSYQLSAFSYQLSAISFPTLT